MSKSWPRVKLEEVLTHRKEFIAIDDSQTYTRPRVKLHAQGLVKRDRVIGAEIKTKKQQVCQTGEFLVAEIDAKMGGFGLVPQDLEGAIVSSHYFLFRAKSELLDERFLGYFCTTPAFREQVEAQGSTNYAAIRPSHVLEYEMPLPSLEDQRRIVARIDAVQQHLQQADALRASIDHDIASLLAVRFQETLQHAEWRLMREVAPLVRREVTIHPEKRYSELGIRSFFKGAFARRTISGAEFTWQKLYEIKAGDLIFSNIMAWEKGIALAEAEHDGCVGNHRMLTCEALINKSHPAYLSHYFTTEEGFAKVYAASPGTAARNRTLTADSLMGLTVPVPTIQVQCQFAELSAALKHSAKIRQEEECLTGAIIPSLVQRTLSCEL